MCGFGQGSECTQSQGVFSALNGTVFTNELKNADQGPDLRVSEQRVLANELSLIRGRPTLCVRSALVSDVR